MYVIVLKRCVFVGLNIRALVGHHPHDYTLITCPTLSWDWLKKSSAILKSRRVVDLFGSAALVLVQVLKEGMYR